MNAPDKIYVSRNFSEDNSPHGLLYLNKSEHDINVEYIRKDALLEWIDEKQNNLDLHEEYEAGRYDVLEELIDKLNSL